MENVSITEIITLKKQYEIQSPDGLSIVILITIQNRLNTNIDHVFHRKILCPAPSQKHLRKNLEAILIALYKPSLKDQKSFDRPMLFRNVIYCLLIRILRYFYVALIMNEIFEKLMRINRIIFS